MAEKNDEIEGAVEAAMETADRVYVVPPIDPAASCVGFADPCDSLPGGLCLTVGVRHRFERHPFFP